MNLDFYVLSIVAFLIALAILIYRDRKNIEIKYILIMRRSRKGIEVLDKLAKYKNFWKIIGTIGIFVAFYLMSMGLISLIEFSRKIISGEITGPTGGIVLPSPTRSTVFGPGFIGIPFWIWIIIIPIIIFPHELFHGIMSRVEKVRVKSFGLLLFGIFPGAFVEPDEKQLKKLNIIKKLRIFVVGSFANFLVSLLLFNPFLNVGLIPNVIWPFFVSDGFYIVDLNKTSPAYEAGIPYNSTLTHINGEKIKTSYIDFLSGNYLLKYLDKLQSNESLVLTIDEKNYTVRPTRIDFNNVTRPYLGITIKPIVNHIDQDFFFSFIMPLFTWMWLLSLAVAVVNILPIFPLDGGLVLKEIVSIFTKKHEKKIVGVVTASTIALLVFSILGPYLIRI